MVCRDDLTFEELVNVYETTMRDHINQESEKKNLTYEGVFTDFEGLGANRKSSCCK